MKSIQGRTRLITVAAVAIFALAAGTAIGANVPGGNPTPADKAVAAGSTMKEFGPGTEVELLSATLRTSNTSDLLLHTSLECSILTKLQTGPSAAAGDIDSAKAQASILGWIEVDDDPANDAGDPNERIVPVVSSSQPPQQGSTPNTGTPDDFVTFCDRTYERTVEDGEDPENGLDRETDYINTKSANAFNWVLLNTGSGVHYVRLVATLTSDAQGVCAATTTAFDPVAEPDGSCTEAYVGNRTLIIEPTKMANDAVIAKSGS